MHKVILKFNNNAKGVLQDLTFVFAIKKNLLPGIAQTYKVVCSKPLIIIHKLYTK
jgi:hypothetical protein